MLIVSRSESIYQNHFGREKQLNEITTRKTKREEMEKVYGPSKLRILHSKNWLP